IAIVVGDDGRIGEISVTSPGPEPLQRLVTRTSALLRAGRWELSAGPGAGTESLRIEVTLSERNGASSRASQPSDRTVLELGFEPPAADKPGRGWFTLSSGRHFDAQVTLVQSTLVSPAPEQPPLRPE
ncbi:MAG: hypothetical protein JRI23_00220, partial [Deltaproteobacteria bacterium]|nr:hypothetical protein [Deltaproteobacteria bacterium]MBW2529866.1 hypothetical protein [Deltaproteobacteria bacterium]